MLARQIFQYSPEALPPVKNRLARTQLKFPVNLLIKGVPKPLAAPAPERNDRVKHGEYLVTMAGCIECHTQEENGQIRVLNWRGYVDPER